MTKLLTSLAFALALAIPAFAQQPTYDEFAKTIGSTFSDETLESFTKFAMYSQVCDADASVFDPRAWETMNKALPQIRTPGQLRSISAKAAIEIKEEVGVLGLPKFCATYGAEYTPVIRKLGDQIVTMLRAAGYAR